MKRLMISVVLLVVAACNSGSSSRADGEPVGTWLTASGALEVEIARCGAALCGSVTRVISDKPMSPDAPKPEGEVKPLLGLKILQDFTASGKGEWKGTIYNRDNGKTYRCLLTFTAADQIEVRGYILLPLIGQTQIWRRVAAPS